MEFFDYLMKNPGGFLTKEAGGKSPRSVNWLARGILNSLVQVRVLSRTLESSDLYSVRVWITKDAPHVGKKNTSQSLTNADRKVMVCSPSAKSVNANVTSLIITRTKRRTAGEEMNVG